MKIKLGFLKHVNTNVYINSDWFAYLILFNLTMKAEKCFNGDAV